MNKIKFLKKMIFSLILSFGFLAGSGPALAVIPLEKADAKVEKKVDPPVIKDVIIKKPNQEPKSLVVPSKDEFVITMSGQDYKYTVENGFLGIRDVKLSLLTSDLKKRTDLRGLSVIGTGLVGLPNWINLLQNLEVLILTGNQIKTLPKELKDLKKLRKVDLGMNPMKTFPAVLLELKMLEELVLPFALQGDPNLDKLNPQVKVRFAG